MDARAHAQHTHEVLDEYSPRPLLLCADDGGLCEKTRAGTLESWMIATGQGGQLLDPRCMKRYVPVKIQCLQLIGSGNVQPRYPSHPEGWKPNRPPEEEDAD